MLDHEADARHTTTQAHFPRQRCGCKVHILRWIITEDDYLRTLAPLGLVYDSRALCRPECAAMCIGELFVLPWVQDTDLRQWDEDAVVSAGHAELALEVGGSGDECWIANMADSAQLLAPAAMPRRERPVNKHVRPAGSRANIGGSISYTNGQQQQQQFIPQLEETNAVTN